MIKNTKDCKIPSKLVPKCPVCNKSMEVNIRKDAFFAQDENWYIQSKRYEEFLDKAVNKKMLLLELGVGFNTPSIIRFPFEQMIYNNQKWNLVRVNKEFADTYLDIQERTISVEADLKDIIQLFTS